MQDSLFPVESNWTPPAEFPNLDGEFSIDLETRDPLLKTRGAGWGFDISSEIRGYPVGIGIGTADRQWYFPFAHQGGGNLDRSRVISWLRDQIAKPGRKIFHNGIYDVGWLSTLGIQIKREEFHDTQYRAALINSDRRKFDLNSCLKDWCGEEKDETLLKRIARDFKIDPKSDLWMLHSKYVGTYGEQDAGGTFRLFLAQQSDMDKYQLGRVYDLERNMIEVSVKMRQTGVRIDMDRLEEVRKMFVDLESEALSEIKRLSGFRARPGVPSADAAEILRKSGVSIPKSLQGNDSVTAEWLERQDGDIGREIVKARQYRKAYRDFIDSGVIDKQVNGRIHASFHPLRSDEGGTVGGRFSCTNPNLQQIPARNPLIGPYIRSFYVGEEGEQWCAADYSSQEPRWTVHFAASINAPGALEAARRYREDPRMDFHNMMGDLCFPESAVEGGRNKRRREAKDIFLGKCYGMGGAKLCDSVGLPTDWWTTPDGKEVRVAGAAGRELLDQFDRMAPFVKKLQKEAMGRAKNRGYVMTYMGRVCFIRGDEHKALNRIIQGSAADQGKIATQEVYLQTGKVPLLLVHDEAGYSVKDEKEAREICNIMETCIPGLHVPFIVDPSVAPNWGEAK